MDPLVPSSILKLKGTYDDTICDKLFTSTEEPLETIIERHLKGSRLQGFVYRIEFRSCAENWMTKVDVKEISVRFHANGSSVWKHSGEKTYDQQNYTEEFELSATEVGFLRTMKKNKKRNIKVELHRNRNIKVELQVHLKNIPGNRHLRSPLYNFYKKNSDSTLAILFGDDKVIFASLPLLAIYSQYFKDLSQKELPTHETSGLPLLELNEFQSDPFEKILYLIYPSTDTCVRPMMTTWTVAEELRLVRFLSMEILFVRYEKWLIKDESNMCGSPMEKLIWSVDYVMPLLQDAVIKQICKPCVVDDIMKHPKFVELPLEVVRLLMKRLLEMTKEMEKDKEEENGSDNGSSA